MTGDRYAFRQRFNRWKQGERYWSIIGQPLPHYADGKDAKSEFVRQLENTPTVLALLADYNKPLNGGTLNEIVVTPTEDANWLFGTGKFKYNWRKPLGDKHTRKVVSNYLSKFDNERAKEYNDRITRLADVLDVNGVLFVENNADPDREGRAYFVGGNEKTAYVDNMRDIFAEISHPWLYARGNNDMMEEVTQDDYNNDIDPRGGTRYAYPDTFEGETHGFFEPTLTEYVTSGKIGKSSPVINKKLSKKKIVPKDYFEVLDSAASWDRQAINKRIISMPDQLPLSDLIKYNFVKFPLIRKNNGQKVLPLYRGGKNSKSSFVQQLETQPTVLQPAVQEWGDMWKERVEPAAKSKVLLKWNATGRKPKPETSQERTNRRIKETTERTWRSDAADIAHGIGEGVLALNPYTAIPYYGAKVGQDVLSGNVNWNTALNASVPLFHLSPQAVGLREATNAVLEDAANAGSKTARNWRVAREINLTTKSKPKYTRVPSKNLFRTQVYKGGEIADPYSNFITTDPLYAANYGKVTPYIFESKSIAKAKEPMMGYRDPVSLDMFIYNNTKRNPNATAIIGHDAVTGEFTPSKGIEILNMNPKNLYPVRTLDFPTSLKFFERKPSRISLAERIGIPKGERNLPFKEKQLTPAQWTAAQDAAIARGDMAEAQRLRDLHFQTSAPNTKVDVPLWTSSEEAFNSFDLSHFGETDTGFFGYGHYLTPIEKYAATYHPINRKFYVNIENPYIGSNDQYFNRIQYVKDRLARRKENVMRDLRDGKLTRFSKKLGINENTSLKDAEHLVDKYIADETVKWNNKYVKYADEFEGKDGVLSWRELQGIPNKQEGIYREVVVPRGEQIKSANAVTYDDKGVRIPLGERDNFNINDIRYAIAPILAGGVGYGVYGKLKYKKTRPIKK